MNERVHNLERLKKVPFGNDKNIGEIAEHLAEQASSLEAETTQVAFTWGPEDEEPTDAAFAVDVVVRVKRIH